MKIIGVLEGICKKKHLNWDVHPWRSKIFIGIRILALAALFCFPSSDFAFGADSTLSTRDNESIIGRDSTGGERTMQTPGPKPQQDYQGPQTIIVAPEVHPGRNFGGYPGNHSGDWHWDDQHQWRPHRR